MSVNLRQSLTQYPRQSLQAIRIWSPRRWLIAVVLSVVIGVALGIVTVLIPNPIFHRDIPPTVWSYPVLVVTAVLSGMLMSTYVKEPMPGAVANTSSRRDAAAIHEVAGENEPAVSSSPSASTDEAAEGSSVLGMIGTFGAWFAIGCPVCNKLALLALGYSGAITYFAPLQPWLAGASVALLLVGLVVRLSGEVACPMPVRA